MEPSPGPPASPDLPSDQRESWTSEGGDFEQPTSPDSAAKEEQESTDRGYRDVVTSWNESVVHEAPTVLWQSSFLGEGEGWDRETGVLSAQRIAAGVGTAAGAAAGAAVVVVGVVTVGLGLIVAGAAGAVHVFRNRHKRSFDKLGGVVDWQEWQPESNTGVVESEVVDTVALEQTVGASSKTLLFTIENTALTVTVATASVPCLFCLELYRENDTKQSVFQLNFQLSEKDKASRIELFYLGKRVGSADVTSLARFRTSMAETFATTEGVDAEAPYHFWLALTSDSVCVGFGDVALHTSAIWFTKPKNGHLLPSRYLYRVATPVMKGSTAAGKAGPVVNVKLGVQPIFRGALETSIRRRQDAMALISSLQYHMHKKAGFLRVLRDQLYIYHVERDFRNHNLRVIVTSGHVVLMRRATGATSKLHVHTQYRTLGIIDLASVFRIDKLRARYHDIDILKLDAVDMSTLLVPALSPETETAILWFVNKLDEDRRRLSARMPLVLRYSLLGECSQCKRITFSGERLGLTLDGALARLTDCGCAVRTTRRTTIASIVDVDQNRRDTSKPNTVLLAESTMRPTRGPSIRPSTRVPSAKKPQPTKYPITFSIKIGCRGMMVTGEVMSPMCVVLQQKEIKSHKHWLELGRTEVAYNSYNPTYTEEITVTAPDESSLVVIEVHLINAIQDTMEEATKGSEESGGRRVSRQRHSTPNLLAAPEPKTGRESIVGNVAAGVSASFYGAATFSTAILIEALSSGDDVTEPIRRARYERQHFGDMVITASSALSRATLDNEMFRDVQQLVGEEYEDIRHLARHASGKKAELVSLFHEKLCRRFCTESATPDDISLTILNLEMPDLLILLGVGANRSEYNDRLLDMFGTKLAPKLSTPARVRLVCTMAPLKRSRAQQDFLVRMILSTHGEELFHLKDGVDIDQSSHIDMSRLVFSVIQDKDAQQTICKHLRKEADVLESTPEFTRPLRVLSDIDDTLVHSGFGLGGPKYKPGTILPGFVPLLRSLRARVAFVTARPAFIRKFTYKTLRNQYGIPDAVCLSGELIDSVLIPFAPEYSNEKISARKVGNIERYMQVFPECDFLWFGDSGQGDMIVGEKMMANRVTQKQLKGVFIQDVVKSDGYHYKTAADERAAHKAAGVDIVENYLDVALELYKREMLPLLVLKRVAVATAKQVRALLINPHDPGIVVARVLEHERKLEEINAIITAEQRTSSHSSNVGISFSTLNEIEEDEA